MLNYISPLYFPNLVFTGIIHKNTRVYSLNWNKKEEIAINKHSEWRSKHWPKQNLPFIPSLPQEIDVWVTNLRFVINDEYRKEINRNARRCLEEWNIRRSFDTDIREFCLKTAETHAFVAFYLLEDCAYDTVNECFYRKNNDDKFLIKYALAYKFWAHQTGRGCVRENARLNKLKKYVCRDEFVLANDKYIQKSSKLAEDFLNQIEKHEKEWEKMSPCIAEEEILSTIIENPKS